MNPKSKRGFTGNMEAVCNILKWDGLNITYTRPQMNKFSINIPMCSTSTERSNLIPIDICHKNCHKLVTSIFLMLKQ